MFKTLEEAVQAAIDGHFIDDATLDGMMKPPYYYSIDDRHNVPYIAGPCTFEELQTVIDDDVVFLELVFNGEAEEYDRFVLHTPEGEEAKIKETLEIIRKMRAGEKLP